MKIIFLIRSLERGGAERQLVYLSKKLFEKGFEVKVVTFYKNGFYEDELLQSGITVKSLDKKGRWDLFGFIWRLIKYIKSEMPNILHGYLGTANILCVFIKPFISQTKIVWGVRASNMDMTKYDYLTGVSYWLECILSRYADTIIANSYAGMEHAISKGFPEKSITVIPNGIDTEKFYPDRSLGCKLRKEWNAECTIIIGQVARLDPMKDHTTFLKACNLLLQKRKDIRFVCVGGGSKKYEEELMLFSMKLGLENHLIWAGQKETMCEVYNAIDIMTLSSSYGEGFPNVIGEAMACCVPCVVTDVGDSARVVGNTGLVVKPGRPEDLVKAWEDMLSRELTNEGIRARQWIAEEFSLKKLIQKTEELLIGI